MMDHYLLKKEAKNNLGSPLVSKLYLQREVIWLNFNSELITDQRFKRKPSSLDSNLSPHSVYHKTL